MKNTAFVLTVFAAAISISLPALAQDSPYKGYGKPRPTPKPYYLKTTYKNPYLKNDYLKETRLKDPYKNPYLKSDYPKNDYLSNPYGKPERGSRSSKLKPSMGTVSINMASVTELTRIPGIGPKTAENIVKYRSEVGPFGSLEDLLEVKGIGKKTLDKLRQFVSL